MIIIIILQTTYIPTHGVSCIKVKYHTEENFKKVEVQCHGINMFLLVCSMGYVQSRGGLGKEMPS